MENLIRKIRLVRQQHSSGCGVACLAAVQNKSYTEAMSQVMGVLRWSGKRENFFLRVGEIRALLEDAKLAFAEEKFSQWSDLPGLSIVGVKIHQSDSGYHHWVVVMRGKDKEFVMDPRYGEIYDRATKKHKKHLVERPHSIAFHLAKRFEGIVDIEI